MIITAYVIRIEYQRCLLQIMLASGVGRVQILLIDSIGALFLQIQRDSWQDNKACHRIAKQTQSQDSHEYKNNMPIDYLDLTRLSRRKYVINMSEKMKGPTMLLAEEQAS